MASENGRWQVELDPMPPSFEPRSLMIHSPIGSQQSEIKNVTVGEVWLATGQSNMVMPLRNTLGGPDRLEQTIRYGWTNYPEPPLTLQNRAGLPAEPFFQSVITEKKS